jgi:hypothetical protein
MVTFTGNKVHFPHLFFAEKLTHFYYNCIEYFAKNVCDSASILDIREMFPAYIVSISLLRNWVS